MKPAELLQAARFPRSSRYNPEWILASVSGGANPLWLTEWLTEAMELRPGMRVLDLSCGRAMSSIFLHREFGVQVWAVDLWVSASENLQRIRDAGGLSWALFVAGVPSTVVSQWKVESSSTRDLMLGFHRGLRNQARPLTKAEALRQAVLSLLKNPRTDHPFYWAGFVLVGDGQ